MTWRALRKEWNLLYLPVYVRINSAYNLDTVLINTEYFYTLLDKRKIYRNKKRLIVYTRSCRPIYLSFHPDLQLSFFVKFTITILSHMLNV